MMVTLRFLVFVSLVAAAAAQSRTVDAEDAAFVHEAAGKLDEFAAYSLEIGFPRRAREVYQEVIEEYDPDDAAARKALGYLRVGSSWAPNPNFVFPSGDRPDVGIAHTLRKRWKSLASDLGKDHREQAQRLEKAGQMERAKWHWTRVARFLSDDRSAAKATGMATLDGLVASAEQIHMLERSRLLDQLAAEQSQRDVDVSPVPEGETHPWLDKAGVTYHGVRTEHFTVWGDWDDAVLMEAARDTERSLAFMRGALDGYDGFDVDQLDATNLAFFQRREDRDKILRANADQFDDPTLVDFIIEHVSASDLGQGPLRLKLAGDENPAIVYDLAVRWPAQMASGFKTDALWEGIGHAAVGRLLGRIMVFSTGREQPQEGTSAGVRKERVVLPDVSSWEQAVVELAWRGDSTPTVKLPMLSAADFPTDARLKVWSLCEYLLRRDPALLLALDQTKGAKTASEVAKRFADATDTEVGEIEQGWRKFWGQDSPALREMRRQPDVLDAFSRGTPAWLEAFNAARFEAQKLAGHGETKDDVMVTWSAEYSAACRQHADYLAKNRKARGPVGEHDQPTGTTGATNAGRLFASSALVNTEGTDPEKVMEEWMSWPGYRDALLNPQLETVGLYVDGSIMVMDVTRGQIRIDKPVRNWPNGNNRQLNRNETYAVPTDVPVDELGPDVVKLLEDAGVKHPRTVGYPISLHFYGGLPPADSIEFSLHRGDEEVPGVLHVADAGPGRRTAATGMVVFYPLQPLPRGSDFVAEWKWKGGTIPPFHFQTQ